MPNIAIMSFCKTLIKGTLSDNIELYSPSVKDFLKNLENKGSIIVIENEYKFDATNIKSAILKFLEKINDTIPFIFIFCLKQNKYKKPNTNIFIKIQELFARNNSDIDTNTSIVLGVNAGRIASDGYQADMSDCDRAFAFNTGINTFRTPEQVFLNNLTQRKWRWKLPDINTVLEKQKSVIEPELEPLYKTPDNLDTTCKIQNYVTIISGPLSSGKTLMSNRVAFTLRKLNIEHKIFDINNYTSDYMMKKDIKKNIEAITTDSDKSFNPLPNMIIISCLDDIDYIDAYMQLFKNHSDIKFIYIEMELSLECSLFLNLFKLQITKSCDLTQTTENCIRKSFAKFNTPIPLSSSFGLLSKYDIKYIKFGLVLRTRPELFYRYSY